MLLLHEMLVARAGTIFAFVRNVVFATFEIIIVSLCGEELV